MADDDKTKEPSPGANWNVRLALYISVVVGCADSIWNGTVLSTYVYELGHSNSFVGYVEAAIGLVQLVVAVPIGAYADGKDKKGRSRKVTVTQAGAPMAAVASVATSAIVYYLTFHRDTPVEKQILKYALIGVMALWGATDAVVMGPFQALFADSLPTGARSTYYSYLYAGYIAASSSGPALSIGLFALWGNDWSPRRLAKVLIFGLALELVASPWYLLFRESAVLGEEADEVQTNDEDEENRADKKDVPKYVKFLGWKIETASFVPWTLFVTDLLAALGSGMTVKFFPLYFKNGIGLSPIQVQIVYTLVPLTMVVGMGMAQAAHPIIGRVQTMALCNSIAVGLLLGMIALDKLNAAPWHICLVYIIRTGLANCTASAEIKFIILSSAT